MKCLTLLIAWSSLTFWLEYTFASLWPRGMVPRGTSPQSSLTLKLFFEKQKTVTASDLDCAY